MRAFRWTRVKNADCLCRRDHSTLFVATTCERELFSVPPTCSISTAAAVIFGFPPLWLAEQTAPSWTEDPSDWPSWGGGVGEAETSKEMWCGFPVGISYAGSFSAEWLWETETDVFSFGADECECDEYVWGRWRQTWITVRYSLAAD